MFRGGGGVVVTVIQISYVPLLLLFVQLRDNVIVGDRSHEYAVLFTPMISASLHKLPNLRWDCVNHFET